MSLMNEETSKNDPITKQAIGRMQKLMDNATADTKIMAIK